MENMCWFTCEKQLVRFSNTKEQQAEKIQMFQTAMKDKTKKPPCKFRKLFLISELTSSFNFLSTLKAYGQNHFHFPSS